MSERCFPDNLSLTKLEQSYRSRGFIQTLIDFLMGDDHEFTDNLNPSERLNFDARCRLDPTFSEVKSANEHMTVNLRTDLAS
jgi:hypothetical protein